MPAKLTALSTYAVVLSSARSFHCEYYAGPVVLILQCCSQHDDVISKSTIWKELSLQERRSGWQLGQVRWAPPQRSQSSTAGSSRAAPCTARNLFTQVPSALESLSLPRDSQWPLQHPSYTSSMPRRQLEPHTALNTSDAASRMGQQVSASTLASPTARAKRQQDSKVLAPVNTANHHRHASHVYMRPRDQSPDHLGTAHLGGESASCSADALNRLDEEQARGRTAVGQMPPSAQVNTANGSTRTANATPAQPGAKRGQIARCSRGSRRQPGPTRAALSIHTSIAAHDNSNTPPVSRASGAGASAVNASLIDRPLTSPLTPPRRPVDPERASTATRSSLQPQSRAGTTSTAPSSTHSRKRAAKVADLSDEDSSPVRRPPRKKVEGRVSDAAAPTPRKVIKQKVPLPTAKSRPTAPPSKDLPTTARAASKTLSEDLKRVEAKQEESDCDFLPDRTSDASRESDDDKSESDSDEDRPLQDVMKERATRARRQSAPGPASRSLSAEKREAVSPSLRALGKRDELESPTDPDQVISRTIKLRRSMSSAAASPPSMASASEQGLVKQASPAPLPQPPHDPSTTTVLRINPSKMRKMQTSPHTASAPPHPGSSLSTPCARGENAVAQSSQQHHPSPSQFTAESSDSEEDLETKRARLEILELRLEILVKEKKAQRAAERAKDSGQGGG
ncbi:hypothetical protein OPT61_g825 [Boeremia exigua]|uniref:Uncharacterized protein n=1 Tax=Boeremia exigua TaxID=749465 RepID=A0ACC2ISH8_9PLEO|nr:hypothetical protein OPT61_g825 [Boeremia exigua]